MRNPQGVATIIGPDSVKEVDTFTCNHCNRVTHVKPKCDPAEVGGFCKICMKMICKHCVGKKCVPFLEKLEQMERKYHARRWMGF